MKLPIRNYSKTPLLLFIEPYCDEYQIPAGGEAIVTIDDGKRHSIDFHHDNWVSLWDEGLARAEVLIFDTQFSPASKRAQDK